MQKKNFEDMLKIYSEYAKNCINAGRDPFIYPVNGILITLDSSFEQYILYKYHLNAYRVMGTIKDISKFEPTHYSTIDSHKIEIITFRWKAIYHKIIKVIFAEPEKMETEIDEYRWKIIELCIEQELTDMEEKLKSYFKE